MLILVPHQEQKLDDAKNRLKPGNGLPGTRLHNRMQDPELKPRLRIRNKSVIQNMNRLNPNRNRGQSEVTGLITIFTETNRLNTLDEPGPLTSKNAFK